MCTCWTYHKDSYMAHRKDWKTGYEGRYRRTHSPTASDRSVISGRSRDHLNNINNIKSSQSMSKPLLYKSSPPFHTNGNLRSAVSTSSLLHRPSSPIDNNLLHINDNNFRNNINNNDNNAKNNNNNKNNNKNNGWSAHPRQKSTTVNFTAEELRAFKARRAAQEGLLSSTGELRGDLAPMEASHITPAPLRPLSRAFSMGEPLHISRYEDTLESSLHSPTSKGCVSPPSLPHDGPITAHPATVTEETSTPPSSPPKSTYPSLLPPTSLSENFGPLSLLTTTSSSTSLSSSSSSSTLVSATSLSSSTQSVSSTPPSPRTASTPPPPRTAPTPAISSTPSTSPTPSTPTSSPRSLVPSTPSAPTSPKTALTASASQPLLTTCAPVRPDFYRSLSSTGTCASMAAPTISPEDRVNYSDIVVLTYGRTPKQEVVECEKLSTEFAEDGNLDSKLLALLAPGPPYKSMADYMNGVFMLEMRKDLLCSIHAKHPDLHSLASKSQSSDTLLSNGAPTLNGNSELVSDSGESGTTARAPLPADSVYFTTSESKAKFLSKIRDGSSHRDADHLRLDTNHLNNKKEELQKSIGRKLDTLKEELSAIRNEINLNSDLGLQVTARVELRAKPAESDKYKLHVEEIDKITSLLLGLSGRLARAENALLMKDSLLPEEKRVLESKRDKLTDQLEEAKKLKENIDRRAVQVSRTLMQYLSEEEYADYDHFIKMKAKLIMDSREIDDKIKLGDEQLQALTNTLPNL